MRLFRPLDLAAVGLSVQNDLGRSFLEIPGWPDMFYPLSHTLCRCRWPSSFANPHVSVWVGRVRVRGCSQCGGEASGSQLVSAFLPAWKVLSGCLWPLASSGVVQPVVCTSSCWRVFRRFHVSLSRAPAQCDAVAEDASTPGTATAPPGLRAHRHGRLCPCRFSLSSLSAASGSHRLLSLHLAVDSAALVADLVVAGSLAKPVLTPSSDLSRLERWRGSVPTLVELGWIRFCIPSAGSRFQECRLLSCCLPVSRFQEYHLLPCCSPVLCQNSRCQQEEVFRRFVTWLLAVRGCPQHSVRMFVVYSSYVHLLDGVASRCGLPFHSFVTEVADDGDVLGGVELELPAVKHTGVFERRFFWACASAGFQCPHDQAALQALLFLQDFYGFVICDFNYHGMLAYRELARSAVVFAASVLRTAGFSRACSTGSVINVDACDQWQVLYSQLVSSACRI